jgi:hypothetical protein
LETRLLLDTLHRRGFDGLVRVAWIEELTSLPMRPNLQKQSNNAHLCIPARLCIPRTAQEVGSLNPKH